MPLDSTNSHTIMVSICDTYLCTHPQMMALRRRLLAVYNAQQGHRWVSTDALANAAYDALETGYRVEHVLAFTDTEFIQKARVYEKEAPSDAGSKA